jgi:hypothetical protein
VPLADEARGSLSPKLPFFAGWPTWLLGVRSRWSAWPQHVVSMSVAAPSTLGPINRELGPRLKAAAAAGEAELAQ